MCKLWRSGLAFGLSMLVSLSFCDLGRADDGKAGNDSKTATVKPAPESKPEAGLTERERWLLERVEQLEKRVADLESKDAKPGVEASVAPGPSNSDGMRSAAKPVSSAPSATLTSASAVPSSMSASIAAAIGPNKESSTSTSAT